MTLVPRVIDRLARQLLSTAGTNYGGSYRDLLEIGEGAKDLAAHGPYLETIVERAIELRGSGEWAYTEADAGLIPRRLISDASGADISSATDARRERAHIQRENGTMPTAEQMRLGKERTAWIKRYVETHPDATWKEAFEAAPVRIRGDRQKTFTNAFIRIQKNGGGRSNGRPKSRAARPTSERPPVREASVHRPPRPEPEAETTAPSLNGTGPIHDAITHLRGQREAIDRALEALELLA